MKAPLQIDETQQRRLTLAGYITANLGVFTDDQVLWLTQNEHRSEIPDLLLMAHRLGRDQSPTLTSSTDISSSRIVIPSEVAKEQEAFWKKEYGVKADFAGLQISAPPIGFKARFLMMHESMAKSPETLYRFDEKAYGGKVWKFAENSLDEAVPTHAHTGTFGFWVADVEEAQDGCLGGINLSTRAIEELGWVTQTLPMRQVHGRKHFREHGRHLDRTVVTLCPGSRAADGNVPSVDLAGGGGVRVSPWNPDDASGDLRFRRAIL